MAQRQPTGLDSSSSTFSLSDPAEKHLSHDVADMAQLLATSGFSGSNAYFIESLYESYLLDPNSVEEDWRQAFHGLPIVQGSHGYEIPHTVIREHFLQLARNRSRVVPVQASEHTSKHDKKQVAVTQMVAAFRMRGHQKATLDPLGIMQRDDVAELQLSAHELSEADFDTVFHTGNLCIGKNEATLREIFDALQQTYCASIGAEYMHIVNSTEKYWVQQRMESVRSHPQYSEATKRHLLERLIAAEGLEKSLASKYPGYKRFGLEGGESLIPLLDETIQRAGNYLTKEIVIGMAHRGRLNVLVNILGKNPKDLFSEFEGKITSQMGSGDVKYHQGFSSNVLTEGGEVHLALAFNPSHLEIVSSVVEGSVRARQDRRKDKRGDGVLPILIHGDAAFAGQGVVMETLQMSQTRAYTTGGTVHIIINNQVGFTTSKREDTRSSEYCTDVAKMVQAPIFHVNGDDPEAVLFVTQMALDFRREFKKDVVVDIICYRRHGHNETDEPSGTQPIMYKVIKDHPTVCDIYSQKLIAEGLLNSADYEALQQAHRLSLGQGQQMVKSLVMAPKMELFIDWSPYIGHQWIANADTTFPLRELQALAYQMNQLPQGFVLQKQVAKILEDRDKMTAGTLPINWGYAENLAYATLLNQSHMVRISGQDVGRGTFSHRHAVLHNQKDGATYIPLQTIATAAGTDFYIYDSLLSEEAVLGFEYGYATTQPKGLVIWEAQFGDFANGAQVVIDQFISSGEHKWSRVCGLTMLLPHGYEGQGPEHSSARLERFLQLCAEYNMQVCVPSTPAQVYHMLRRQALRPLRKPLIVMTPKSLLRHKLCTSTLEELANGSFQMAIGEIDNLDPEKVDRVIMCSGRVYYDLLEKRRNEQISNTAIVRLEQLYPFPEDDLLAILKPYKNLRHLVWCQEEPRNQGAWYCRRHCMQDTLAGLKINAQLHYAGRAASAAPAAGYMSIHTQQQEQLVNDAFTVS
jgi:2-oxoglutarate dehydrogenase E1 component